MTTIIKPTVGRVVHFHADRNESLPGTAGNQPLAAIIAWVHSDRCVNLAVFDANGDSHSRTSVTLVQEGDERPVESHAQWMPYQIGQAAKTEQLEKDLAGKIEQLNQGLASEAASSQPEPEKGSEPPPAPVPAPDPSAAQADQPQQTQADQTAPA